MPGHWGWMTTDLSEKTIGAILEVANTLGAGFLEKVYERALVRELGLRGMRAEAQVPVEVSYKGENVGSYFVDIVVEDELMIELKCADRLGKEHTAQCLNYLKASGKQVCLLVNFQNPRVEWQRVVWRFGWDEERTGKTGLAADER